MAVTTFQNFADLTLDLKILIINNCDIKGVTPADINADDFLINGAGALQLESIDAVAIVVAVDRQYGVKIEDLSSARTHMRSINSLAQYIFTEWQNRL